MVLLISTTFIKLKHVFVSLFSILCRAVCCRRRMKRSNSGLLLPLTTESSVPNKLTGFHSDSSSAKQRSDLNYWQSKSDANTLQSVVVNQQSTEEEDEPDYFKDMAPTIKRPKKVLISNKEKSENDNLCTSSRLNMDTKAGIITTAELGLIEESNNTGSWEDEASIGESFDVDASLRDARQAERERRLAEHKRIKQEKEMRKLKSQRSNLVATKIS